MFISEEINEVATPPWTDSKTAARFGALRGDLDHFVQGDLISVAMKPFDKAKSAFIARLNPTRDGVWDIRSRDPKPAIRVFGMFAEVDMFVALTWEFRQSLGGPRSTEWHTEIERCKTAWRKLFPVYGPVTGDNVDDYLSGKYFLV